MVTLLTDEAVYEVEDGRAEGEKLWLREHDLERITGWHLKPEGFCRNEVCVPVPLGQAGALRAGSAIDAASLWQHLGQPVLHTADGSVWMLGEGARTRTAALKSLQAPDFTLPDLSGRSHSLSDHRGKKVLLVTWASW